MNRLVIVALGVLSFVNVVSASTVKCFYPPKNLQVCLDVNDLEPNAPMNEKMILSGCYNDLKITIMVDNAIDCTAASERDLHGKKYADNFGVLETVEKFDCDRISCIRYQLKSDNGTPPLKNGWAYHGYAVKDNVSFDICISANITKHDKTEIIDIIKSFKVSPTEEIRDLIALRKSANESYDSTKDRNIQAKHRIEITKTFLGKYTDNPEAHLILGNLYMQNKEHQNARDCYLAALKCYKLNLLLSTELLWTCYDNLGMYYAMTGELEKSKPYFESEYDLAKKGNIKNLVAASAYNLACYYGESNNTQKSLRYLSEAIQFSKKYQKQAAQDSSFNKVKSDSRFTELVGKQ
jgi:tetratricopeptide (TPR) repeat protein